MESRLVADIQFRSSSMSCPNCGAEHNPNSPCQTANEGPRQTNNNPDPRRSDEHPLVGLDNPFWKPEKPAA
jgi:hypothetical protein